MPVLVFVYANQFWYTESIRRSNGGMADGEYIIMLAGAAA